MGHTLSELVDGTYRGYRITVTMKRHGSRAYKPRPLRAPNDVYEFLKDLSTLDREVFYALHLDAKNNLVSCEEVSRGCLTWSVAHPREIYKGAILASAASVIVAHNHPSGDPHPSMQDQEVTERIRKAGELLGIPLIDSVIIGDGRYYSFQGSWKT
jgi:DNA repair protein RadC